MQENHEKDFLPKILKGISNFIAINQISKLNIPQVTKVMNKMPRTIELILEGILSMPDIGGLADITTMEMWSWLRNEHFSPCGVSSLPQGPSLLTPNPFQKSKRSNFHYLPNIKKGTSL